MSGFTPIKNYAPTQFMNATTYKSCTNTCNVNHDISKCGTTSMLNSLLNENFRDASCVIQTKIDHKNCVNDCKKKFGR